jgi:hypothetical protein
VTNTLSLAVSTNTPCSFDVERLANGDLQFTILGGQINVDYVLEQTTNLCECPCLNTWQSVGQTSPDTMPFQFIYPRASLGNAETLFFRLNQVPRP